MHEISMLNYSGTLCSYLGSIVNEALIKTLFNYYFYYYLILSNSTI